MSNESIGSGASMWLIPAVVRAVSLTFMLILEIWLSPKSEGPSAKKYIYIKILLLHIRLHIVVFNNKQFTL